MPKEPYDSHDATAEYDRRALSTLDVLFLLQVGESFLVCQFTERDTAQDEALIGFPDHGVCMQLELFQPLCRAPFIQINVSSCSLGFERRLGARFAVITLGSHERLLGGLQVSQTQLCQRFSHIEHGGILGINLSTDKRDVFETLLRCHCVQHGKELPGTQLFSIVPLKLGPG